VQIISKISKWWRRGKVRTPKIFKPFPQFETKKLLLREINSFDAKDLLRWHFARDAWRKPQPEQKAVVLLF
jgi:hypothetical protein